MIMYDADRVHVVNQVRPSHIEATLTERQVVMHERVIRFGGGCIEPRASIVKVPAAGDRSAQATATQVDPDEIEPIKDLTFYWCFASDDCSEGLTD